MATRKRNRGWFKGGYDPRRHQLTDDERRRGGFTCVRRHYLGGAYARYLGQCPDDDQADDDDDATRAGNYDRPGKNGEASADASKV